jgi:glycosyltransferase involved in cell wall biosynthesis
MNQPIVTVVILNYNQDRFLPEAVQSVLDQSYTNIEIILVDDASTDGSKKIIAEILALHPEIKSILNKANLGNCRSFNKALAIAKGKYIIDLAADDMLLSNRVQVGVETVEKLGEAYAVHYCNALHIDEQGENLYTENHNHPSGDVYRQLIQRYFVNTASMLMRKSVLDELDGYDESLSYEDFDFWIRSSRKYKYVFEPQVLVAKRDVPDSLSKQQFKWRSKHLESTYRVCQKIRKLNESPAEDKALRNRIRYEIKLALRFGKIGLTMRYLSLYFSI